MIQEPRQLDSTTTAPQVDSVHHDSPRAGTMQTPTVTNNGTTSAPQNVPRPTKDLLTVAAEAGSFTTLSRAVSAAGLTEMLQGKGPYTLFAPTNQAFGKLPAGELETLLANKTELVNVLKHHLVAGQYSASDLTKSTEPTRKALNGRPLGISVRADDVYIDDALVSKRDMLAANGVIHGIDALLMTGSKTDQVVEPVPQMQPQASTR
jgi:uncharacterized surface protein with fasciclin (FAS1) repeats